MKFKEYSFKDLLVEIVDNRGKTCPTANAGIPLIATNCIKNDVLYPVFEKVRYVDQDTYDNWFRGHPEPDDMIFVCKGSPGRVAWVPDPINFCIAQDMVAIRADKSKVYPKYLFALLRSNQTQKKILNMHVGTLIPHFKKGDFGNLFFDIPEDLNYQKKVGDAYYSFCEKIELNRQINHTLEQIVQTIFKSWFVDFEPVKAKIQAKQSGLDPERAAMYAISGKSLEELEQLNPETQQQLKITAALFPDALVESELGEIPEGWGITELGEIIGFNPKRTLKKGTLAPYLDMKNVPTQGHLADDVYFREMTSGTKFINGDTLLARITPCLENGKTAYVDFLENEQVAWGSTEYIVMRPKNDRPMSLGYIIARLDSFRSKAIQTMTGTSGRQRANAKALSEQSWLDYPIELLEKFDSIAGSYLDKAKNNGDENKILSDIRDTLLPQLLSGEFQISNKELV